MITLSMIVKNEEKYLRECLESVQGAVDEIVIVDTGSTDNTINIAKEFGAKIYHFDWINDFSAARNYALERSTHDWILYLDADERLMPESKIELKNLGRKKNDKAYFCFINNVDEINGQPTLMIYLRFFPNKKYLRFEGKVHEQIDNAIIRNKIHKTTSNIHINHIGYNISRQELQVKARRNLELLFNDNKLNPSSYNEYQIGQTYGILDDKENAVKYMTKALCDKHLSKEFRSVGARYLSVYELDRGNYQKAIELIEDSLQADPTQPYSYMAAAKLYVILHMTDKVEDLYKKALDLNKKLVKREVYTAQASYFNERILIYDGLSTALSINNKVLFNTFYKHLLEISGTTEVADELVFLDALFNNKDIDLSKIDFYISIINKSNINLIVNLLHASKFTEKGLLFEKLFAIFPTNPNLVNKYGQFLLSSKRFDEAEKVLEMGFDAKPADSSIVFYLTSVYLNTNKTAKIKELMKKSLEVYSSNFEFMKKYKILEQKLSGMLG